MLLRSFKLAAQKYNSKKNSREDREKEKRTNDQRRQERRRKNNWQWWNGLKRSCIFIGGIILLIGALENVDAEMHKNLLAIQMVLVGFGIKSPAN